MSHEGISQDAITQDVINHEAVVEFLNRFELLAEKEDFDLIADMVHEQAFFRFNDGDFIGRRAVRAAFETTWASGGDVKKERFYLSDIVVLSCDALSASATYTYHWEGAQGEQRFRIQGRGTRVMVKVNGGWQIIHEHLSRFPTAP